jgi:HEAT repeat protein
MQPAAVPQGGERNMRSCLHASIAFFALFLLAIAWTARADTASPDERILQSAQLKTDDAALLELLRKRTVKDTEVDKVRALIKSLGNDDFNVREKATADLVRLGSLADPFLREALKNPDPEVVRRAEECLSLIKSGAGSATDMAALRLVAARKPPGAAEALLAYLPFATNHLASAEVKTALTAVALRDGHADKAVVAALTDKMPQRRAAAALALCRACGSEQHKAVRPLLQDADLTVRLHAAIALAEAHDKEAVAVLINLLPEGSLSDAWQAEDMLLRIAQEKAPKATLGLDDASRKKCRDIWADWWAKNNATLDLTKLPATHRPIGNTMVILLDSGIVQEMDAKGKMLWQLKDIQFPLDAQLLPGGERVLLAEHGANKVTERTVKDGKVVWEKDLNDGPLAAQRLPNGNTFVAMASGIVELDKEGKEVYSYRRPVETIRKAMKLPNGDIAMITSSQRYVRISPDQKELRNFEADVRTNGGRIDVLPNGHILVPLKDSNKVIEYDSEGKAVWEATVEEPVAAVRLPNGHTLITTLNQKRAIELDGAAQEVWEYKSAESRVTRAWRR